MTPRFLRFLVSNPGISPENIPIPPVYHHYAIILVGPILVNFWAFVMPWHVTAVTVVTVGRSLAVLVLKCCIEIHLLEACWMLKWRFKNPSEPENMWMSSKWSLNHVFCFIFCWQNGRFLRILLGWGPWGDDFKARSFSDKELGQAVPGTRFFYSPEQRQPVSSTHWVLDFIVCGI